jgi:hypothetical protein
MKWRARLAILLGVLLPVPLIWTMSSLLLPGLNASRPHDDGNRFVPILAPDETRRLLTFEKDCEKDEDCEAPLVCLSNQLMWKSACVASTCTMDADCAQGLSCHSIAAGERVLRRCGAPGEMAEGEFCMELPRGRRLGCAPGLLCTYNQCRRPCQLDTPQNCPEGYFCSTKDAKGSVCLPTCEGRSCPEGQRCVTREHGVSICARVHGTDCQLNPCPVDQVCHISDRESQGDVWMMCALSCDEQRKPCPEGYSCMVDHCRQQCSSDAPGSCGPMETCAGFSEHSPGICIFDTEKK